MALSKITYDNKVALNPQPSIANVNKCTDSDLNEIKNVVNAGIDTINGNGTMGDIVVDSIRTKNMFDKSTLVQGDIIDTFPTLRITSRQVIWLEAGTYTASTNLSSTYQWGIQIQNVGILPLSSYPTYIYETGWQTTGTTEKTFTINTAGWYNLMVRRSDNGAFTNTDLTNIFSSNYQLEKGEEATTYTPYQSLNYGEPILDITKQITWKSGFELKDGKLWKQGKRIFGTLNIGGTWTTGTQVIDVFTIPYSFPTNFIFGCTATTRDQWGYPDGMAYCYMSQWGHFNANANINAKFLRVQFEFITT